MRANARQESICLQVRRGMVTLGIFPGWARALPALSCLQCVPKASHIRLQMNVLNGQLAGMCTAHNA
jgi:hypothetical protein